MVRDDPVSIHRSATRINVVVIKLHAFRTPWERERTPEADLALVLLSRHAKHTRESVLAVAIEQRERERECVCECVCVCEREREREREKEKERKREREREIAGKERLVPWWAPYF